MGRHVIRIETDEGWEQLGKERFAGIEPSPPQVQSDPAGFASCSFVIPRPDAVLPQPDLTHSAKCEIDFDGVRIFEGRVSEAPVSGADRVVNVQGRGWQYALDENPIPVFYTSTELGEWKDCREFVGARIFGDAGGVAGVPGSAISGAGTAEVGDGQITIGHSRGSPWPAGGVIGVTRDFGPNPEHWPKVVTFDGEKVAGGPNVKLFVRAHTHAGDFDNPRPPDAADNGIYPQLDLNTLPTGKIRYRARFPFIRRHVTIFLSDTGAGYTPANDDLFKISNVVVYNAESYERSGESSVRASSILRDAFTNTPGVKAPLVATPTFADEAGAWQPAVWFRGRAADVTGLGTENYSLRGNNAPAAFGSTPGPLPTGQPSFYTAFDGVDDGLVVGVDGSDDITLAIVFRTSQAAPAGTSWPSGRGLFDAATVTAGDQDYGLQIVAGGKVSGGIRGGAKFATPNVVVNDGNWHTAVFRRRRLYASSSPPAEESVISVWVDDVEASTVETVSGGSGNLPLAAMSLYLARNAAGNFATVDIAEALLVFAYMDDTAVSHLINARTGAGRGYTIARTFLNIPSFWTPPGTPKTMRSVSDDVNMYHRYRVKVGRDRTPYFQPQPTTPKYALTDDAVERFTDTSMSAAADTYNRVHVLGTRPDGRTVSLFRYAGGLPGARLERLTTPAFANPGGEVNATGWNVEYNDGTTVVTRVTTGQRTGAGGFRIATTGANNWLRTKQTMTGTFEEDVVYVVGGYYRLAGSTFLGYASTVNGTGTQGAHDRHFIDVINEVSGVAIHDFNWLDYPVRPGVQQVGDVASLYVPFQIAFSHPYNAPNALALRIQMAHGVDFYFDDLWIARSRHHRLDRLGQLRTRTMDFGQNIDVPTSVALADAFLQSRLRTPFAGSLPIGPGDLVTYGPGSVEVPPAVLCDNVGELVHFPGLIDPDGYGPGRDGQIASVSFDSATEIAQVSFDNTRDNFEALVARGALLRGGP